MQVSYMLPSELASALRQLTAKDEGSAESFDVSRDVESRRTTTPRGEPMRRACPHAVNIHLALLAGSRGPGWSVAIRFVSVTHNSVFSNDGHWSIRQRRVALNILLTNDDGIDAPGLAALEQSVGKALQDEWLSHVIASTGEVPDVTVAAPDQCRSECGHSVTNGTPIRLTRIQPSRYRVVGTPVDCVRLACCGGLTRPDAVISGVNAGANLGVDLLVSGTFAAAREAAIMGIPALAISHYRHPEVPKTWAHVAEWSRGVLTKFLSLAAELSCGVEQKAPIPTRKEIPPRGRSPAGQPAPLWNVNLPAVDPAGAHPSLAECEVDTLPHDRTARREGDLIRFESNFQDRPRTPGRDTERCFAGHITLSKLTASIG